MRKILFTAREQAELKTVPDHTGGGPANHVRGRTLVSLVSPGTELNGGYLGKNFPVGTGYACVFEIDAVGDGVDDLQIGDRVFACGPHAERQQAPREQVTRLPDGLAPEVAVFARLMSVSMNTLNTAAAHPPARVLVTGLGPVGNLAAQVFARCGYQVSAVDPIAARRQAALASGIRDVRAAVTDGPDDLAGRVALHVECSGHEQAVLDGCNCVCKRGEVVLVGVPWGRKTDLSSFDLLHAVFHRYVVVRSGWEWEVPGQPRDFSFNSLAANHAAALAWLHEGTVRVDGLAGIHSPDAPGEVYAGLLARTLPELGALFDWRRMRAT